MSDVLDLFEQIKLLHRELCEADEALEKANHHAAQCRVAYAKKREEVDVKTNELINLTKCLK